MYFVLDFFSLKKFLADHSLMKLLVGFTRIKIDLTIKIPTLLLDTDSKF